MVTTATARGWVRRVGGRNRVADESGLLSWAVKVWLLGTAAVLPVRFLELPGNLELVDAWVMVGLPIAGLHLLRRRETIGVAYALPLGLIAFGSLISTFGAIAPSNSFIVLLKELYIVIWFTVLIALFSRLATVDVRRFLRIWSAVVVLHGVLMIAQFLSPPLWRMTARLGGRTVTYADFRPSGLFFSEGAGDANFAAVFQLMGCVPLLLVGHSKRRTIVEVAILLCSVLVTGSMGVTLACVAVVATAVLGIAILRGGARVLFPFLVRLAVAGVCLGGVAYLVVASSPEFQNHLDRILLGRSDRSAEGRFDLWTSGLEVLIQRNTYLWGIGPENFREIYGKDKQLHNDLLAFSVERGGFAVLGLVLLFLTAVARAAQLLNVYSRSAERPRLEVVVFLAAIVGLGVVSLVHQVFHTRELWLTLALQEGMHSRMGRGQLLEWED
jgi:O-antigen ligase/polysaccharide polymerase Wzy-like membrane protein